MSYLILFWTSILHTVIARFTETWSSAEALILFGLQVLLAVSQFGNEEHTTTKDVRIIERNCGQKYRFSDVGGKTPQGKSEVNPRVQAGRD